MPRRLWLAATALLLPLPPSAAGEAPAAKEQAVEAAIDKGVRCLLARYGKRPLKGKIEKELILYALLHGGLKPDHPFVKKCLPDIEGEAPRNTYNVGLALLLFHRLDPVKYRHQIARGAAFLVQSQCANGQWAYSGTTVPLRTDYPVYEREEPYIVYGAGEKPGKGKDAPPADGERLVARKLKGFRIPSQAKPLIPEGDNSNMQYALLGLRAAAESGCLIPEETWARARAHVAKAQQADGGLGYDTSRTQSTHTMTTAGAAMLAICDFYLKKDLKADPELGKMLSWLEKNFSVEESTCIFPGDSAHYYYLYGLERAAVLADADRLGAHDWYAEGAAWLVAKQGKDGAWQDPTAAVWGKAVLTPEIDTALAILFLRRSTVPLIPLQKRKDYEVE